MNVMETTLWVAPKAPRHNPKQKRSTSWANEKRKEGNPKYAHSENHPRDISARRHAGRIERGQLHTGRAHVERQSIHNAHNNI